MHYCREELVIPDRFPIHAKPTLLRLSLSGNAVKGIFITVSVLENVKEYL